VTSAVRHRLKHHGDTRAFFEKHFDTNRLKLEKPQRVHWINGEPIEIDKYAPITIAKTR